MHSLSIIKDACVAALEGDDPGSMADFRSIADPQTVLDLVTIAEKAGQGISEEELLALGNLVRDLTGYITLHCGSGSDSARDDMLLQAGHLLGLTGI